MSAEFFEKLKRGMDIENTSEETEEAKPEIVTQQNIEDAVLNETPEETSEPETDFASIASIEKSSGKTNKKRVFHKRKAPKKKNDSTKIKVSERSFLEEELNSSEDTGILQKDGELTVDVFETEKDVVIQSAIAGIAPEDLDITIEKDMVSIRGRRERQFEEKTENFVYQECYWGRFSREIVLPAEVDKSKAEAIMKNGILTIRIPKTENSATKKLDIEIK